MSNKVTNPKPTVNIIGPGRLGMALGIALSLRGYTIRSLIGRRLSSVRRAAAMLDVPVDLLVTKDIGTAPPADLLIISTPDDQIASVVKDLSTVKVESPKKPFAFHTSGALSSEVLSPLFRQGWRTGSLHPLVSVSDPIEGAASFKGAFWCVEGEPKAVRLGRSIVRDLHGHSFSLPSSSKPLYHAAAVMTSGNVVALFDVAIEMLSHGGLKRSEAKRVLLPLLESTAQNLVNRDPAKALTGTFSRGDIATVERHMDALSGKELLEARTLYRLLGKRSLALAIANGMDRTVARRISKKLDE